MQYHGMAWGVERNIHRANPKDENTSWSRQRLRLIENVRSAKTVGVVRSKRLCRRDGDTPEYYLTKHNDVCN